MHTCRLGTKTKIKHREKNRDRQNRFTSQNQKWINKIKKVQNMNTGSTTQYHDSNKAKDKGYWLYCSLIHSFLLISLTAKQM